jgi:glutathione S-transferase
MILVGQYDSPFTRRVAVTLHHYRMPFTRDTKSVFGDAKAMQKINPLIRVPSLILQTGEILIDSVAIVDFLDEQAGPARALVPPHGAERRNILQVTALAQGAAEKAGQVVYERFFHEPKAINGEWEKRCFGQLTAALEKLEARCGAPWFFDMKMSHADVMTGCLIGYLKLRLPEAFPSGSYRKLHALALHCETREEFVKSQIAPTETMPKKKPAGAGVSGR